jgi:hypothetical protein
MSLQNGTAIDAKDGMVHPPDLITQPNTPPTCPKCGSHRTQVVGTFSDSRTLVVRCNACGARSEVTPQNEAVRHSFAAVTLRGGMDAAGL